jgi:hypothetical protein
LACGEAADFWASEERRQSQIAEGLSKRELDTVKPTIILGRFDVRLQSDQSKPNLFAGGQP